MTPWVSNPGTLEAAITSTLQIHGVWFYENNDLERLSTLLNRVKSGLPRQDLHLGVDLRVDLGTVRIRPLTQPTLSTHSIHRQDILPSAPAAAVAVAPAERSDEGAAFYDRQVGTWTAECGERGGREGPASA